MGIKECMEWLDKIISWKKEEESLYQLNSQVSLCRAHRAKRIHVYSGIEILADVLGKELVRERWEEQRKNALSFAYKGYTVFQLEELDDE